VLVDRNEIAKLVKEKKVTNSIELNVVLCTIAKEVIETMYKLLNRFIYSVYVRVFTLYIGE
jgi:hypothetical protein